MPALKCGNNHPKLVRFDRNMTWREHDANFAPGPREAEGDVLVDDLYLGSVERKDCGPL